jgi:hypothetical protein
MAFAPTTGPNQPEVALASFTRPVTPSPGSDASNVASPAVFGAGPIEPIEYDALVSPVGQEVMLSQPRGIQKVMAADTSPDAPIVSSADDSSGLIVTAFKKTGDSLASLGSIGAKTGTSIFGAFRVVGSAVRKALPL